MRELDYRAFSSYSTRRGGRAGYIPVCGGLAAGEEVEDIHGLTAADVAERAGHQEIAGLLRGEQMRMEFFE